MSLSRNASAAAQRQAIVTVDALPDLVFSAMSGGGITVSYEEQVAGGVTEITVGRVVAEPIVLTTALSLYRDLTWMRQVKAMVGVRRFTITRQWTDPNWAPVGEPETYPDCLLIGYTNPESSPSVEDAEFSLTFATTGEAL